MINKTKPVLVLIFALIIGTTTVYAYNEDSLKISTKQSENLDIKYENIKVLKEKNASIKFIDNDTDIDFNTVLKIPGDYIEFTVDVVNYSSIDAKISEIEKSTLTEYEQRYLKYEVRYVDGSEIKEDQILKSNDKKTIKVRIEYKYDITEEDLPTSDTTLNLNFNIIFNEVQ